MTSQEHSNEEIVEQIVDTAKNANTPISTEHFSNDSIKLTLDRYPHCMVGFTIHVGPKLIEEATRLGIKKVAKDVSIPGFRKGKAPEAMILKKFGKAVDEKVRFEMAQLAYVQAQQLARTPLLNQDAKISYDVKEMTKEHAVLHFRFETEPTMPEIDTQTLSINDVKKEEITEEKLSETIHQIRSFYSTFETVSDRPAQDDDHVILDIEDLETDPPSKVFSQTRFHVKKGVMSDWMYEILVGMNTGESKEALSRPNESDSEEIKAEYKPKKVRVTLALIEVAKLPVVDDEFAKRLGVSTVEEMNAQLTKQLELRAQRVYMQELRNSVSRQLLEKYGTFEIPNTLLVREVQHRTNSYMSSPQHRKQLMNQSKEENDAFQAQVIKESGEAIRMFYLCKHIVESNHIRFNFEDDVMPPSNMIEAMFNAGQPHTSFNDLSKEEQALQYSRKMLAAAEDFLIEKLQKS